MSLAAPEIETTGSRVVYQNRWMTVREDSIRRADGSAGIYGVVEKTDFVCIVARRRDALVLVEQFRYPVGARFWEFPQGSWEGRTVEPLDLAKAELREETGYTAATMRHAGRLFQAYGYSNQAVDVYLAEDLQPGPPQLDAEEAGLVSREFPLAAVHAMIDDGTIRDITTVAAFGLLRLKGWL